MKKKLYLHLGLGKTGTSFLQTTFALNEINYKNNGLLYPDISNNHKVAVQGITTSGNGFHIAAKFLKQLEEVNSTFDEVLFFNSLDKNYDYLISSEWLNELPIDKIKEFIELTNQSHEPHLIFFYRSIPDLIISNYHQGLKQGSRISLLDKIEVMKNSIRKIIDKLIAFSDSEIKHSIFNYDCSKNLICDVDNLIFGRNVTVPFKDFRVNPSPDLHQINILRLVADLEISDFGLNMRYIEKTSVKGSRKFLIDKKLAESIENEFEDQINQLNKISAKGHIYIPYNNFKKSKVKDPLLKLNPEDINHLKDLIKNNSKKIIFPLQQFIDSPKNSELPDNFNSINYLLLNPELILNQVNPELHYIKFGKAEGRSYLKKK